VVELIVGTVVVASVIAAFALAKCIRAPLRRHRAVRRSLSCSALQDLHNKQLAINACADMFERFEERCPGGRRTRISRVPSLPALIESDGECFTAVPARRRTKSLPGNSLEEFASLDEFTSLDEVRDSVPGTPTIEPLSAAEVPPATLLLANERPDDTPIDVAELPSKEQCLDYPLVEDSVISEAKSLSPSTCREWAASGAGSTNGLSREEPQMAKHEDAAPKMDPLMVAVDAGDAEEHELHEWSESDPSPTGGSSPDPWAS